MHHYTLQSTCCACPLTSGFIQLTYIGGQMRITDGLVLAFNPSTWEAEAGGSLEFKASPSSKTARTTQRNPVLKNRNRKQTNKKQKKPGVVAHAFNPSTREAEAGGFLSSRPAWSTE
uniref:Uncharacterized protein n=1 Tax=Mus spicilegus TaxID=10103 RepID=A0A8C6HYG5_MUSSI